MLKSLSTLLLFVTAVFAQNAVIGLPTGNQTVSAGSNLIVQVQRPNSLTGSQEVAVVIGLQSCPGRPCTDPSEDMGTILYSGPFNPQSHDGPLPPYENFTVQVPDSTPHGSALLGVTHVSLIGAGYYPNMELLNQTITVV